MKSLDDLGFGGGGGGNCNGLGSSSLFLDNKLVKQLKESIHRRAGQLTQAVRRESRAQCEPGGRFTPRSAAVPHGEGDGGSPGTLVSPYGVPVFFSYQLALP